MKAIEYYEKYKNGLHSDDKDVFDDTFQHLALDMSSEFLGMLKTRNIKTYSSLDKLIDEFNKKGNKICAIVRDNVTESQPLLLKQD